MSLPPFSPFVPEFRVNPYGFYRRYREHDPVHWNGSPDHTGQGSWCIFRHDDIAWALKHPSFGKTNMPMAPGPLGRLLGQWMLLRNPPDHTRLRGLVNKGFTPHAVDRMHASVQGIADELLDDVQEAGEMDAIVQYASALPLVVIAELLGIPRADRALFRAWSVDLAVALDVVPSRDGLVKATKAILELTEYLRNIVSERRRSPRADLITVLIDAEDQGEKLTEDELLAMCILLLGAGHETTVNLIGNGLLTLLLHPAEMARLRDNPSIGDEAVDELLRYDSSVQMVFREALTDVELRGRRIRHGEAVTLFIGSANRDPDIFPDPDTLNLTRGRSRHIAFGMGIHFCLGAPLARLEARIAFQTLLRRMPNMSIAPGPLHWSQGLVFRGLEALPIRF